MEYRKIFIPYVYLFSTNYLLFNLTVRKTKPRSRTSSSTQISDTSLDVLDL